MRAQWEDGHLWTRKWPCQTLNLQAPSSPRTVRHKDLLFKPPGLQCLCYSSSDRLRQTSRADMAQTTPQELGTVHPTSSQLGHSPAAVFHEMQEVHPGLGLKGLDATRELHIQVARPLHHPPQMCLSLATLLCVQLTTVFEIINLGFLLCQGI